MTLMSLIFPDRVWPIYNGAASYKPYNELSDEGKKELRRILGVKRFTTSVYPFEYQSSDGTWRNSLQFCVPGNFGSFPPFNYDDPKYPGLAATLHKAYAEDE